MTKYVLLFLMLINVQVSLLKAADHNNCHQGWYVGGIGGVNFLSIDEREDFEFKTSSGLILGGAFGYKSDCNLRYELESLYRYNKFDAFENRFPYMELTCYKNSFSFFCNVLYDFNCFRCFTPYVGVGFGYTYNSFDYKFLSMNSHSFAATQLITGVSIPVSHKVDLSVEGRCIFDFKDSRDGCVNLSLRRYF